MVIGLFFRAAVAALLILAGKGFFQGIGIELDGINGEFRADDLAEMAVDAVGLDHFGRMIALFIKPL
jgi:hypothetical protein